MQGEVTDIETGQDIPQDVLIEAVKKYARLIEVLMDLENGTMVLNYQEYLILPATFIIARRIFKHTISQLKSKG